jgi:methionine-rich copper-binding protein CopC
MQLPGGSSRVRTTVRAASLALAVLAIAAWAWVLQAPEDAQAALVEAQPSRSAHLGHAPEQVRLSFAQAPAADSRSKVTVLSPKDENLARGRAVSSSVGVSQQVAAPREQGAYQVTYEVQLADGKVARGEYWFWYAPNAPGSRSWLQSPLLQGIAFVALAAVLLALGPRRKTAALVSARRAPVTTNVAPITVPAQRSPQDHEGLSPPGSRPRPGSAPGAQAGPTGPPDHGQR